MKLGFPEYGAHVSPGKSLLSFHHPGLGVQVMQPDTRGMFPPGGYCWWVGFPFCGFLIDMKNLDISMDHKRMLNGRKSWTMPCVDILAIEQSFALRSNRRKGSAFVGWLSRQLENRNHVAYVSGITCNQDQTDDSSILGIIISIPSTWTCLSISQRRPWRFHITSNIKISLQGEQSL
jgi:hypothetical protein